MSTLYAALGDRLLVVDDGVSETLHEYDIECVTATPAFALAGTVENGVVGVDGFDVAWPADAPQRVTALAVSPAEGVVWAGTEPSAVYRSSDRGRTWTACSAVTDLPSASSWSFPPRPHTHHVHWIEPDPHEPRRLYVGIEAGALLRTDDGGETWRDHPEGARRDNHELATHPDAPGRVYAAAGDGYAESPDGGETWTYPQEGLQRRYVWSVAVDPADPEHVLVSAARGAREAHNPEGSSIVAARRGGTWERAMDGLPGPDGVARPLLRSGPDGGFYALSNHGVFRSTDGRAWSALDGEWREAYREQVPRGLAVV